MRAAEESFLTLTSGLLLHKRGEFPSCLCNDEAGSDALCGLRFRDIQRHLRSATQGICAARLVFIKSTMTIVGGINKDTFTETRQISKSVTVMLPSQTNLRIQVDKRNFGNSIFRLHNLVVGPK